MSRNVYTKADGETNQKKRNVSCGFSFVSLGYLISLFKTFSLRFPNNV